MNRLMSWMSVHQGPWPRTSLLGNRCLPAFLSRNVQAGWHAPRAASLQLQTMRVWSGQKFKESVSRIAAGSQNGAVTHEAERPFLIGVAGGTASGKTSLCTKIMNRLQDDISGQHVIVNIAQDSFYRDLTPEEASNVKDYNFDHPDAFAFDEIVSTLHNLRAGRGVEVPVYSFVRNARCSQTISIPSHSADVILFDGILAFYTPELRNLFDIKIFVDTDADTRLARRVRRDIVERGRDVLQVLEQYERTVKPSFDCYIQPTKQYADVIVPRGAENEVAVGLILQHIKWKLSHRVTKAL